MRAQKQNIFFFKFQDPSIPTFPHTFIPPHCTERRWNVPSGTLINTSTWNTSIGMKSLLPTHPLDLTAPLHRHVIIPKDLAKQIPMERTLTEPEWRSLGIQMSRGWIHYAWYQYGSLPKLTSSLLGLNPTSSSSDDLSVPIPKRALWMKKRPRARRSSSCSLSETRRKRRRAIEGQIPPLRFFSWTNVVYLVVTSSR